VKNTLTPTRQHLPELSGFLFSVMAYFSNGSEGMVFDDQCCRCKYGRLACPIAFVQQDFNYDQHKDQSGTAQKILGHLVKPDGTCTMWDAFRADFEIDPSQLELFSDEE
jgi:hypothetical protein